MKQSSLIYFKYYFLIVMLYMVDFNFVQIVIYLVEYNEQGVMGLVINCFSGFNLVEVFEQFKLDVLLLVCCQYIDIYNGGLVQIDCGFVFYFSGLSYQLILELGELVMFILQDVLFVIVVGIGLEKSLISFGYVGWEVGQLEVELSDNVWLICLVDLVIFFDLLFEECFSVVVVCLGVNFSLFIVQVGYV